MKKNQLEIVLLSVLMLICAASCEKTKISPDEGSLVSLSELRAYVLNQGSQGSNNAGIAFIDASTSPMAGIADIYFAQNGVKLGDVGQDLIVSGYDIYVTVSASMYVARLNAACVEQCRHAFNTETEGYPRSMALKDGHLYVSLYGGIVVKLNAETLAEEARLQTTGKNLEGMSLCGDNLYVCNSWYSQDGSYYYCTDLFVIDLNTFSLKETLNVTENPNEICTLDDKLFLLSYGNYWDVPNTLQMIDTSNDNAITCLGTVNKFAIGDNKVFMAVNKTSDWINYTSTLTVYDIKTGLTDSTFFSNAPAELTSSSVYMMSFNPYNGDIYVITSDYYTEGKIYRFDIDGHYEGVQTSGGLNPCKMIFVDVIGEE